MIEDENGNKLSIEGKKFTVLWGHKTKKSFQMKVFEDREEAVNFIKGFLDFDPNHLGIFLESGTYSRLLKEYSRPDTDKQSPLYANLDLA